MFWQTEILVSVTGFQHVVAGQSRGGQKVWDLGWGIPGGGAGYVGAEEFLWPLLGGPKGKQEPAPRTIES